MSRVYLPIGKKAHTPYRIQPLGIEVFTLEELCYYIVREADLLEKEFMNEQVCTFVEEELKLPELAEALLECMEETGSLQAFCELILREADYLPADAFSVISEKLYVSEKTPDPEKMVKKLDALFANREYHNLIRQTDALLGKIEAEAGSRENTETAAVLYDKQATAYAMLFYYGPAADRYEKEMECYRSIGQGVYEHKAAQKYLLCKRLMLGEEKFHGFVEEHPEYLELSLMAEQRLQRAEAQTNADIRRGIKLGSREFDRLIREFERM